jgi:hypothetical protein
VYEILRNETNGSHASKNHYGKQTVKMDSRNSNYFIFPLYFIQLASVTLT